MHSGVRMGGMTVPPRSGSLSPKNSCEGLEMALARYGRSYNFCIFFFAIVIWVLVLQILVSKVCVNVLEWNPVETAIWPELSRLWLHPGCGGDERCHWALGSLATPTACGIAPFWSISEVRMSRRAQLCTGFPYQCAQLPWWCPPQMHHHTAWARCLWVWPVLPGSQEMRSPSAQ